jgi:hypothetical protein
MEQESLLTDKAGCQIDKALDQEPPLPIPHSLLPLLTSNLRDYVGRTIEESLQIVRELTGLSLTEISMKNTESSDNKSIRLGKSFWAAFVRGGYQGAVYYIDRLRGKI